MESKTTNIKLPKSAIDFLDYCRDIRELSEGTIVGYENDLKIFIMFLKSLKNKNDRHAINDKYIKTIELKQLYGFMTYLKNDRGVKNNSATTRSRKVATLKAYFNYLQNKAKLITYNPAYELESPEIPDKKPIVLNVEQSKKLITSLDKNSKLYKRDYCILTLFLQCGIRLSELCNIKLVNIKDNIITIFGKGSKERYVYLNVSCVKAINEYLEVRKVEGVNEENLQYLFLSERKQKININTVQVLVKSHLKEADLTDKKYSTHKLRGSYATMMSRAGANINQISKNLGHKSIKTTQRYICVDEQELKILAEINPLNNL